MLEIIQAQRESELDEVRALVRAFVDWCRVRYVATRDQVDAYFAEPGFSAELAALPGIYAPPRGRVLLARWDGQPVGCVLSRPFDAESTEMKRMYVDPQFHGRGIGRALAEALIREAQISGYQRMLLDTGYLQVEAQALYHSLGFVDIVPYYPVPPEATAHAFFMELRLEYARVRGAPVAAAVP